jgi:agmatinase
MTEQGSGHAPPSRGNMPFTGIATFARAPYVTDLRQLKADFAVYGLPFDGAVGFRSGQRMAPRSIRAMSTRFGMPWGPANPGFWSVEEDRWYLQGATAADVGDVDLLYYDQEHLDRSTAELVGAVLDAGAVPVGLGGDHSVTYPMIQAFERRVQELSVVQIDAHLDFTDDMSGFRRSNSSPLRRAAEHPFVRDITVLGLRGLRTNREAYAASLARGNRLVLQSQIRRDGIVAALGALPSDREVYLTIDIDALDPSIAPATSSPEWEGMNMTELRAILREVAARNRVVGIDLVEVNPYLDIGEMTSLLAARILLELMGWVHAAR